MIRTTIVGYGESNLKLTETYIYRLDNYLSSYYPSISWNIHNAALRGATTREMLRSLKDKVLAYNPNLVFINLSSNDSCSTSNNLIGLKEFEENLSEIAKQIKLHNNRTGLNGCIPIPLLITPPPINELITGVMRTNNRLKQYVYIIKKIASEQKLPIIDLFDIISAKEDYMEYVAADGFSLSQKGQDLLYDLVFIELTKLINYQGVLKDRDVTRDDDFRS
ncbi:MAG: hypothetical protein K0S71_707 [Clostridia bacterium]|jgi:lysophospholipase L1-like esterase|nr:hypothetical protein [Clostridia bacterium]